MTSFLALRASVCAYLWCLIPRYFYLYFIFLLYVDSATTNRASGTHRGSPISRSSHWCPWQSPALARCEPRRALRAPWPLGAGGGARSTKTAGATLKLRAGEENRPVGRSAIETSPSAQRSLRQKIPKRKPACKRPSPSIPPQGVCAGGSCGRKGALLWHRDALRRHHASHAAGGRR